jgi:hypothetical protein
VFRVWAGGLLFVLGVVLIIAKLCRGGKNTDNVSENRVLMKVFGDKRKETQVEKANFNI